jgi:hypothetical protein
LEKIAQSGHPERAKKKLARAGILGPFLCFEDKPFLNSTRLRMTGWIVEWSLDIENKWVDHLELLFINWRYKIAKKTRQ